MKKIVLIVLLTATSCAAARKEKRLVEYKKMTKNICVDNQHEVELAQLLYLKYVKE